MNNRKNQLAELNADQLAQGLAILEDRAKSIDPQSHLKFLGMSLEAKHLIVLDMYAKGEFRLEYVR